MQRVKLGHSDLEVSSICLGTMTFGRQNTEADGHDQLDLALARGVNFIDTAEMYPVPTGAEFQGRTETIVGSWLRRGARDRVVLATKAAGPGHGNDWVRDGQLNFTAANLQRALDGSLQRLGTDHVDLYQLHWPDRNVPIFGKSLHFDPKQERPTVPLLESMHALDAMIRAGKIRHWGLSNETPWGLMTCLKLAEQHGLPRPVSVQNAYNLVNRSWEMGLSEIGWREGVSLLAYSPLGFGLLSAKYQDDPLAVGRATLFAGFAGRYAKPNTAPAVAAYSELARSRGLTPTQLALAFVYRRWCVTSAIIGATSLTQLTENLDADAITLDDETLQQIEAIHLRWPNPAP